MKRFKRTVQMGIPIGLVLLLLLLMAGGIPILAQGGGSISGHVTAPITSGSLIPPGGTIVRLIQPGSDLVLGQATVDSVTGDYSFPAVDDGMYFLQAVPPDGSSLTPSQPESVMVSGNAVTVNLSLTRPQVFGTVAAPNGSPAEAVVSVFRWHHKVQQTATSGGQFKLGGLPMGNYTVQAAPVGTDPYWESVPVTMTIVAMPGVTTTTRLTLTNAQLWGSAQGGQGHPVPGAMVAATNLSGTHRTDFSNADGFWTLGNLPDGEYWLEALPPADRTDLLTPPPFTVTLPGAANPFTLTFSQTLKQAHGTVRTNTGAPVQNALVVARRVNRNGQAETHTAGDGTYQIDLSPGLWALTVKSISGTVPADWVYADPPVLLQFARDTVTQTRQQDFTVLTADGTVTGTVLLPTGSPPPFKVTIGLYNDEGVGVRTIASTTTGQVSVAVPHGGYKVVVHAHNPAYLGPAIDPIDVPANGTVGLGTMTLLLRNAVISGTLTDNNSDPVSGVPVIAWRAGVPGSLHTLSGPNGRYVLFAAPGTWQVRPAPGPVNPYIFTGTAATVELADGQHLSGVDFSLVAADATISGSIVDSQGNPAGDVGGWVTARSINPPHIQNGAPISNSVFAVSVPAGTYNVLARLSPGGDYISTGVRQVTVGSGETVDVSLVVEAKDAAISGAVYDARNAAVPAINGAVAAWQNFNWAAGPLAAGLYRLNVAAGLWHFDYRLDPTAGYAKLAGPRSVAVESGQDKIVRLPVALKDGLITGTVKSPDGSALGGALVVAKGFSDDVDGLWLKTLSQSDGSFSLAVPYGNYRLGAVINNRAWLKPLETTVSVPQGGASGGHVLQFRQPNATLGGTVTVSNTTVAGPVFVWAWSDDGAFSQRVVTTTLSGNQAAGPYQLNVLTGTTWHVGARFETGSAFWRGEATVSVDSASVTQNLILTGPNPKPGPVAVLFNAADEQAITLADGTEIYIPAGAMPVSGDVLLRIVPLAALPNQADMRVVNYGYAFLASDSTGQPIEEHFNQDVTIHFTYDDSDVLERWLKPAYYSTTTNEWTFPESYVVDTAANEVTMQIDHFTDFALLDTQTEPALSYTFNTGRDGWLVFGDANGGSVAPDGIALPNYSATGGFPGGYVYAVDEVTGGTWFWLRRFTDTVDVSTAYSHTLSFALRQTYLDSQYRYPGGDIILEGGTGITTTLTHRLPFHPLRVWTPYWIRLHKSAHWIARRGPAGIPTPATEADFMAVLGSLKSIKIRGEYRDGGDTGSLDNVIVGGAAAPSMQALVSHLTGGRLVFTSSTVSRLDFPPGMAGEPFTVTVSLTDTTGITNVVGTLGSGSMVTPDFRPVGPAFIIEARRPNGSLLMNFNRPFTITIRYDAGEADGLDEPGLSLYYRGSAAEQWQVITTTHGVNVLTATVDHLTQFAVLGAVKTSYSVYLPLIMR